MQPQPRQSVLRQNKLRIFRFRASAKAQSLRLFLLSPQSGHFVGPQLWPDIVCPNRLGGMMQPAKAAHGAFLARRKLAASGSSRAPCAFPNLRCYPRCWLFSCLGLWSHPHISPKEHQKERCGHSRPQRSFITFHGALWNILLPAGFPVTIHMIALEQTFVNDSLQKIFSC